jgi:GDPmannose 4,6-dehydratase
MHLSKIKKLMKNKTVVITGASGQTGSLMVDYLLKNTNHKIIGSIRRTSQLLDHNVRNHLNNDRFSLVYVDLNDIHSITNLIKNEQPDYFLNFGGCAFVPDSWNSPALTIQTNTIAVIHILEAIKNYAPKCRFYNACSSEVFGKVLESPQSETTPPNPRSIYGVSKLAAKNAVSVYRDSYGLFAVSGVCFNHESKIRQEHYVTRKITKSVARIAKAIQSKNEVIPLELGNLNAQRDWSHASDFCDGIWLMLNNKDPQDYVISSNETHTIREFVEIAFSHVGIKGYWENLGSTPESERFVQMGDGRIGGTTLVKINPKFYRPAEVDLLLGDSSKARTELGWEPKYSFQDLIKEMVENDLKNSS